MPVSAGKRCSRRVNASRPPAEAPIPTTGPGVRLAVESVAREGARSAEAALDVLESRCRFFVPLAISAQEMTGRLGFFRAISDIERYGWLV